LSAPPDPTIFFTDRDLGTRFPEILSTAGIGVRRHRDLFPHDCPDEIWLEAVAKHGWIAVSHDARIRYKPNERTAVVSPPSCCSRKSAVSRTGPEFRSDHTANHRFRSPTLGAVDREGLPSVAGRNREKGERTWQHFALVSMDQVVTIPRQSHIL